MTAPQTIDPDRLEGLTVIDNDGDKVGKVTTVFIDTTSERPEWVSVKTGFFGSNETLVPLRSASLGDDEIRVPYTKEHIKSAPHHNPEEALSDADEGGSRTEVLTVNHRMAPEIRTAVQRLSARLPGIGPQRELVDPDVAESGTVQVRLLATEAQQAWRGAWRGVLLQSAENKVGLHKRMVSAGCELMVSSRPARHIVANSRLS